MKLRLFFILNSFAVFNVFSQNTSTQYPDEDSQVAHNLNPTYAYADTTNYSTRATIAAQAGTISGYFFCTRAYIGFDLSPIPSGASINSAQLILYGSGSHQNTTLNGTGYLSNACYLRRTTQGWSANAITWKMQPSTTATNQVSLAASTSISQNYTCVITQLVKDMISNPGQGDGLELILQTESQYCQMSFYSSEYSDATKRPTLIIAYTLSGASYVLSLSTSTNYIHTSIPIRAMSSVPANTLSHTIGDVKDYIQYFDGLGRPVQSIEIAASPNKKDIIQPVGYDNYGRENVNYLPYTDLTANGSYRTSAIPSVNAVTSTSYSSCDQYKFYQNSFSNASDVANDAYPYSQTKYETSPLNRIQEQGFSGADWQPSNSSIINSGHTNKYTYLTNTASEVRYFKMSNDTSCLQNGTYAAGMLYIIKTTDENGNIIKEYKDKEDRIILKKSYNGNDSLQTYYVYDNLNLLRFVIPPQALDSVNMASIVVSTKSATTSSATSTTQSTISNITYVNNPLTPSNSLVRQYCYFYRYDTRHRLIVKQLPGADSICMVYDLRDRLVLSQDGNMRKSKKWLFTKYDILNRPVLIGLYDTTVVISRAIMQSLINAYSGVGLYEERASTVLGYTNRTFPWVKDSTKYLTATYYDTYGFWGVKNFDATNDISGYSDNEGNTTLYYEQLKGLVTGTRSKVLGTSSFLTTTNYYDDKYRIIESFKDLYDGKKGYELVCNQYDFTGKLTDSKDIQIVTPYGATSSVTTSTVLHNTYDHAGRLLKTYHQVNGGSLVMIAKNDYNEIGQLTTKYLHNETSPLQTINYKYNIRGWLKKINDPSSLGSDVFGEELLYNEGLSVLGGTAQYNGNISGIKWHTAGTTTNSTFDSYYQGYGFTYDGLNRLKLANYGYATTSAITRNTNYDVSNLVYDRNGNILSMKQNGYTGSAFATIDNLSYTYQGNQLYNIKESATSSSGIDFTEGVATSTKYSFDANGNLEQDLNKNIQVSYYYLNLPSVVTMTATGKTISYFYDATGEKLREVTDSTTRYYFGNNVYKGSTLDYIITTEGIADNVNGSIVYNYNIKDHLGNVRAVIQANGTSPVLIQTKDYYPFGLAFRQSNAIAGTNRYLYNGKEWQDDKGLKWYDYGARFYDPQIGRWHSPDALAENALELSPYHYCHNNSINFIDPYGLWEKSSDGTLYTNDSRDIADLWSKTKNGTTSVDQVYNCAEEAYNEQQQQEADLRRTSNFIEAVTVTGHGKVHELSIQNPKSDYDYLFGKGNDSEYNKLLWTPTEIKNYINFEIFLASFFIPAGEVSDASLFLLRSIRWSPKLLKAAKTGAQTAYQLGRAGEEAVGTLGPKTRILVDGRIRIPDALTRTTLTEVKNVKSLSLTRQLRDFSTFSQQTGRQFMLYTRPNTVLSAPLQQAIDNGLIIQKFIPGL
jgi:RHS repeat-associated protein